MIEKQLNNKDSTIDEEWWTSILEEIETLPSISKYPREDNSAKDSPPNNNIQALQQYYEDDVILQVVVKGCNRGGLLVENQDLKGFLPLSHLIQPLNKEDCEKYLSTYVGQTLSVKIIEFEGGENRIIVSERAAQTCSGNRNEVLDKLQIGSCTKGLITTITHFGVFIDLGGVEGLAHISELSWGRVNHPREEFTIGEEVDVFILEIDKNSNRISLSLKRLCDNPWESADIRYQPGQQIEATISSIVQFGAFAEMETGLDGLIHISELRKHNIINNGVIGLEEGMAVTVEIIHVDTEKQRIGLRLVSISPQS